MLNLSLGRKTLTSRSQTGLACFCALAIDPNAEKLIQLQDYVCLFEEMLVFQLA